MIDISNPNSCRKTLLFKKHNQGRLDANAGQGLNYSFSKYCSWYYVAWMEEMGDRRNWASVARSRREGPATRIAGSRSFREFTIFLLMTPPWFFSYLVAAIMLFSLADDSEGLEKLKEEANRICISILPFPTLLYSASADSSWAMAATAMKAIAASTRKYLIFVLLRVCDSVSSG